MALALSAGATAAQEVILFDRTNFGGGSIRLTQSAPDLDAFRFDNETASIRVVSGRWTFHRDDDFQNNNGPPIELGPGNYPDIEALGFPRDRMSSVRLLFVDQGQGPGPETIAPTPNCPAPYQQLSGNGQCQFTCAEGTEPHLPSGECRCVAGTRQVGTDQSGRRVCRIDTANPPLEGRNPRVQPIRPPQGGNPGVLPRLPVTPSVEPLPRGEVQTVRVSAADALAVAQRAGFSFSAIGNERETQCRIAADRDGIRLSLTWTGFQFLGMVELVKGCSFGLFGSRQLAPGWRITGPGQFQVLNNCAVQFGDLRIGPQPGGLTTPIVSGNPFRGQPQLLVHLLATLNGGVLPGQINFCTEFSWRMNTIDLQGPAGQDWRQAFGG